MMKKFIFIVTIYILLVTGSGALQNTKVPGIGEAGSNIDVKLECLKCHSSMTPDVVDQWKVSKHGLDNVKCYVCHGEKTSEDFVAKPKKERCRACHPDQVKTLSESKMNSIACGSCHSVHQFSSMIARETRTCTGCHETQGEFYNGSTMERMAVGCSNCHFHEEYPGISSHSLKVEKQNCATCHDSERIKQVGVIENEIAGLLLEAKKDTGKQAAISIIENDGTMGFHNPKKAKEILMMQGEIEEILSTEFLAESDIFLLAILLLLAVMVLLM